jgi:hypothetical protein
MKHIKAHNLSTSNDGWQTIENKQIRGFNNKIPHTAEQL